MDRYVRCENKSERDLVLKRLEDAGYRWLSGDKPTALNYWHDRDYDSNVFIINDKEKTLSNGWRAATNQISAADFLKTLKGGKDAPIVIYRNGDVMTAVDKATKKIGKATCSPSDEFDCYTGAMIALCRLVGADISEDAYKVMRQLLGDEMEHEEQELKADDLKVGDRVEIKSWDEMERKYSDDGMIRHDGECFNSSMKHLCGRIATVTGISAKDIALDFDDKSGDTMWNYRAWMLKRTNAPKPVDAIKVGDTVKVINTGKGYRTYTKWVAEHVQNIEDAIRFDYGEPIPDDKDALYTVLAVGEHDTLKDVVPLCYIKNNTSNKCYLIGIDGLKKV